MTQTLVARVKAEEVRNNYVCTKMLSHHFYPHLELVDSISRDAPDMPIYAIQYKKLKNSVQIVFQAF